MRVWTHGIVGCVVAVVGVVAWTVIPASSQERTLPPPPTGPVVGEAKDFREKARPRGSEIYRNTTTKRLVVTVIFEAGTDSAQLSRLDPSGDFSPVAEAFAKTADRQKSASVEVESGGTLWIKSDGGTSRWQIVSAN